MQNASIPPRASTGGRPVAGVRRHVVLIVGAMLLFGMLAIVARQWFRRPAAAVVADELNKSAPVKTPVRRRVSAPPAEASRPALQGQGVVDLGPRAAGPAQFRARAEATSHTRGLVSALTQFDLRQGVSAEAAQAWKRNLDQLREAGVAAVPAIREFLDGNLDFSYQNVPGAAALGHGSLRLALLDVLQQIGGSEAIAVLVQTLQITADPTEIAVLGRAMGQLAPAQLSLALDAARETLALAGRGDLSKLDVAPLFQLLQAYGGSEAVGDLAQASLKWNYYATMALADLPDGAGIPALVQLTQDAKAKSAGSSHVARRLLAQMSVQYPRAQSAFAELAAHGQIPESTWTEMGLALSGYRLQFNQSLFPGGTPSGPIRQNHYVTAGNQRFSTSAAVIALSPEQLQQQLRFVDELLRTVAAPTAQSALLKARGELQGRLGQ